MAAASTLTVLVRKGGPDGGEERLAVPLEQIGQLMAGGFMDMLGPGDRAYVVRAGGVEHLIFGKAEVDAAPGRSRVQPPIRRSVRDAAAHRDEPVLLAADERQAACEAEARLLDEAPIAAAREQLRATPYDVRAREELLAHYVNLDRFLASKVLTHREYEESLIARTERLTNHLLDQHLDIHRQAVERRVAQELRLRTEEEVARVQSVRSLKAAPAGEPSRGGSMTEFLCMAMAMAGKLAFARASRQEE